MQQLIDKALELNNKRREAEKLREQARLAKDYEDARIMLKAVLGDDADAILDDAVPFYVGDEDKSNRSVYVRNGDWLIDDYGHHSNRPTCRLVHVENRTDSWSSNWETFTDLASFGEAVRSELHKLEHRREVEQRQVERAEQLKATSPHIYSVSVLKRLIFDIEANERLSTEQQLVVALVEHFRSDESIPDYSPDDDVDDSEDDE